jgi:ATP-dependent DNA helicase RecQ
MQSIREILHEIFGFTEFREGQEEVVHTIVKKRDVLVLFPTGNGKSLCYQIAGLCMTGLTIVITPLLALMQDQVSALQKRGIRAETWNSTTAWNEKPRILSSLLDGSLRFLYLSPEKLLSPAVKNILLQCQISLLVVDEAHCVSQWSPEFRPLYGKIPRFLASYCRHHPRPVLAAFSATATRKTCDDITRLLNLQLPHIVALPFFRPNLRTQIYQVHSEALKRNILLHLLRWWKSSLGGSALIYAATRGETEWLAEWVTLQGFPASAFHAGLSNPEKKHLLEHFLKNERALLVCTSAFGMGVDKPNVRLVVHHTPPTSLEAYTQEAGRAGRDQQEAWPVLLYNHQDLERNFLFTVQEISLHARKKFLYQQALQTSAFAERSDCLHRFLYRYFLLPQTRRLENPLCHCGNCSRNLPWLVGKRARPG